MSSTACSSYPRPAVINGRRYRHCRQDVDCCRWRDSGTCRRLQVSASDAHVDTHDWTAANWCHGADLRLRQKHTSSHDKWTGGNRFTLWAIRRCNLKCRYRKMAIIQGSHSPGKLLEFYVRPGIFIYYKLIYSGLDTVMAVSRTI